MPNEPKHEPAAGAERVICWFVIAIVSLQLVISALITATSEDAEFHILQVMVPPVIILIAVARLKGWVNGSGVGGP